LFKSIILKDGKVVANRMVGTSMKM